MATVSNDADEIRRQMATIRRELHEDVQQVVATAEAATDWHRYLTMYPWASVGAAFALGYLIVPRRHKSADVLAQMATHADVQKIRQAIQDTEHKVASVASETGKEAVKRRKSLIGATLGMLAPLAWRAAQGYALKYAEQWIADQQNKAFQGGPPPTGVPPTSPGHQGFGGPGSFGFGGTGPGRPSGPRQQPGRPDPHAD